jgi:hypothetical protein
VSAETRANRPGEDDAQPIIHHSTHCSPFNDLFTIPGEWQQKAANPPVSGTAGTRISGHLSFRLSAV